MTFFAEINVEAVVIFSIVLSITLGVTYWASKRMTGASTFYAAGRQITGMQNGLAISGDYLSAASFLGIAGLIYLYGFDGFLYSIGFLVAFLTVMFLLAERMRNAGKYTIADVLSFRLRERPARTAAAMGTLAVAAFYLIAQMVGRRRADPGARRDRLQPRGGADRRLHALLRDLRRHARHHLGADHQGGAADGRHRRDVAVRARARRLQPDRAVQPGRGEHDRRVDVLARARDVPVDRRSTPCRSASRWCSARPGCRTS